MMAKYLKQQHVLHIDRCFHCKFVSKLIVKYERPTDKHNI